MWQSKTVERALFKWNKWRQSLVRVWASYDPGSNELASSRLNILTHQAVKEFNLPDSAFLELYWACCVVSNCNMDYEASFDRIVISEALELPFDPSISDLRIEVGMRAYPPVMINEKDVEFFCYQHGLDSKSRLDRYRCSPDRGDGQLFVDKDRELYPIISKLRGRPSKRKKVGRLPNHSDHLAIRCAVLKDSGEKYVTIADRLGLPVKTPFFSEQSDIVRHLVRRGERLLKANPING